MSMFVYVYMLVNLCVCNEYRLVDLCVCDIYVCDYMNV